jgi:hypothetical protein
VRLRRLRAGLLRRLVIWRAGRKSELASDLSAPRRALALKEPMSWAVFNVPTPTLVDSQETGLSRLGGDDYACLEATRFAGAVNGDVLAMANAAQRQRKLAAKVARRKAVVAGKKNLEVSSASLVGRIRVASKGPFVRCLMPSTLFDIGIGHVVVARLLPSGLLGCAFFLVDVFCLGIKDVFYAEMGEDELRSRLAKQFDVQRPIEIEPARARKLIRDAAGYAAGLGLSAAKDTSTIEAIFGDVDAGACSDTFIFGRDGKPFFISGPNDTPARIRVITQALEKSTGFWDYLIKSVPGL